MESDFNSFQRILQKNALVALLEKLQKDYRSRLADRIEVDRPDVSRPLDLAENEPKSQTAKPGSNYSEEGPIVVATFTTLPFSTLECMASHLL